MYITFRRKWYIMNANKLMAWLNNKSLYICDLVVEKGLVFLKYILLKESVQMQLGKCILPTKAPFSKTRSQIINRKK